MYSTYIRLFTHKDLKSEIANMNNMRDEKEYQWYFFFFFKLSG